MKGVVGLLLLALVATASALAPLHVPHGEYIENEYIVVLKKGMPVEARDVHIKELQDDFAYSQGVNEIKKTYHIDDFVAFHAKLSQDMLARERVNADVQYIDYNGIVKALDDTCHVQSDATWGLDRINEVGIQLDGQYNYGANGDGVDAYIIDTGIQITHEDFGGRATWGTNTADDEDVDCNGHGTHVAGTVGGTAYGVAKGANLIAVKTLNCAGSGTWDGVIEGINWTADQGKSTRAAGRRSVANMSLGGGFMQAVNDAVEAAIATGIPFAIAAGNSNDDACNHSPASAPNALTAGATTVVNQGSDSQADRRASFSSYGSCVDIFAPGQLITSAWIGSDSAIRTISGTSMASPHVAGAAAVVLSANPDFTIDQVAEALGAASTKSVIDLACGTSTICKSSPNALLFSHCA